MTFIPGVATSEALGVTFMDCPGFLDNRGAVINIANAVNIKQAIHAAKDVVVVILLNYASLIADRGRGLRELVQILQDLFGEGASACVLWLLTARIRDDDDDEDDDDDDDAADDDEDH